MSSQEITDQIKTETFEFTGRRGQFFKLLLINLLLTIITLGIYRFWAKTNVRRFIWSNIRFMGDPLEYTGKGSELLLGFLIVLAVLFPLGLIYEAIQSLAPPEETALHIGLEVLYYIIIFALIQIGFYRAWRYRMSRTAWRGIRLGLDGSTWTFLKLSLGWSVLTVLTLGIAYPWMAVELWRYQITHTRIGQTAATFTGTGKQLLSSWIVVLLPIWLIAAALLALGYESGFDIMRAIVYLGSPEDYEILNVRTAGIALVTTGIVWLLLQFLFGLKLIRFQISGIDIGDSSALSKISVARLLAYVFLTLIGFFCVFLITMVIAVSLITIYGINFFEPSNAAELFFGFSKSQLSDIVEWSVFAAIAASLITLPFTWTIIYFFEFIKQLFIKTSVSNPRALEDVIQSASDSQKTGEGLADALDIGGL